MSESPQKRIIPFCSHKGVDDARFFSNWAISPFHLDGMYFISGEQYMMYQKAMLFGDIEQAEKVTAFTRIPENGVPDKTWDEDMKAIKQLGRGVKNFVPDIWDAQCEEIVTRGLLAKFSQNMDAWNALMDSGDAVICEAASYDKIWGIGLSIDNPGVHDVTKWQGKNLLGQSLMNVRSLIQQGTAKLF